MHFKRDFYEKASSFFAEFYSNVLNDNCNLKRACLMGIVELQGGGILSELNNLVSYPCDEDEFSQYFGFTAEEITAFLKEDREEIQGVMEWFNGYFIGSCQVINPFSFMSYIDKRMLKSYWTRTANLDSILSTIYPETNLDLVTVLKEVYDTNDYEIGELLTVKDSFVEGSVGLILSFLVHTGYLTYKEGKVMIPNKELQLEWRNYILGLTSKNVMMTKTQLSFLNALNAGSFNFERLEEEMREMLKMCSFYDLGQKENLYHLFYFGIFVAIYGPSRVKSNFECGNGRCNIAIEFDEGKKVVIFEFKVSKIEKELANDAEMGLKQIVEKKYHKVGCYAGWNCFAIGVSFFKNHMSELKCKQLER
jgi:Predicted AAA-ATPase/PD-(D/E)XK nuclease superfamily